MPSLLICNGSACCSGLAKQQSSADGLLHAFWSKLGKLDHVHPKRGAHLIYVSRCCEIFNVGKRGP